MIGLVVWFNFSDKCTEKIIIQKSEKYFLGNLLAVWTTVGVFPEPRQTIDQTTGNPRSTKTANDRPCPSTGGDSGVNSSGNLIMNN